MGSVPRDPPAALRWLEATGHHLSASGRRQHQRDLGGRESPHPPGLRRPGLDGGGGVAGLGGAETDGGQGVPFCCDQEVVDTPPPFKSVLTTGGGPTDSLWMDHPGLTGTLLFTKEKRFADRSMALVDAQGLKTDAPWIAAEPSAFLFGVGAKNQAFLLLHHSSRNSLVDRQNQHNSLK